jgi:hypothetical protein
MSIASRLPRWQYTLILGWLCILAHLSLIGTTAAGAASAKPKAPLWGISTDLYGKTALPGSHFTYALAPGTVIKDAVILHNFASKAVRLNVYPADLKKLPDNGLAPAQAYEPRRGAGAWIHLKSAVIAVPPHQQVRMPFTVSVPHGVAPGDYYGSVVAAAEDKGPKGGIHIATRAALIVHFSVPGKVKLGVTFGKLRAQATAGGESFSLNVTNTGNVTFVVTGSIMLGDGGGRPVRTLTLGTAGLYVVPGGEATLTAVWSKAPLIGRTQARAVIKIAVNGKVLRTYTSETVRLTFFPWKPVIIALSALMGGTIIGWRGRHWIMRRFREWREDRGLLAEIRAKRRRER